MAKKLHYFDIIGLGESIRYLLHYGKQKFEDIRYPVMEWPVDSVKDSLPFGQLPLYEEGGRTLNQSLAIARYVARSSNLVPSDPWEQAVLDATVYNIYDYWKRVLVYIYEEDPVKKQEIKETSLSESIEYFLSRFEKQLKENKGFVGGKLSWADFVLVGIIESTNFCLEAKVENKYLHIAALVQKINNLPGVKEYVATRKTHAT